MLSRHSPLTPESEKIIFGTWEPQPTLARQYVQDKRQAFARFKTDTRGTTMLKWALIFFVISLIAGVFGFTGISAAASGIARILFFIAVVIFVIFLVLALMAGQAIL